MTSILLPAREGKRIGATLVIEKEDAWVEVIVLDRDGTHKPVKLDLKAAAELGVTLQAMRIPGVGDG